MSRPLEGYDSRGEPEDALAFLLALSQQMRAEELLAAPLSTRLSEI